MFGTGVSLDCHAMPSTEKAYRACDTCRYQCARCPVLRQRGWCRRWPLYRRGWAGEEGREARR
eukprot:3645845-Rhodomonas_salina.1